MFSLLWINEYQVMIYFNKYDGELRTKMNDRTKFESLKK